MYIDALVRAGLIRPEILLARVETFSDRELDDELTAGGAERKRRMLAWIRGYLS